MFGEHIEERAIFRKGAMQFGAHSTCALSSIFPLFFRPPLLPFKELMSFYIRSVSNTYYIFLLHDVKEHKICMSFSLRYGREYLSAIGPSLSGFLHMLGHSGAL